MKFELISMEGCGPCEVAKKKLNEVKEQNEGFDYEEINIATDRGKKIAKQMDVEATPTLLANDGKRRAKIRVGPPNKEVMNKALKECDTSNVYEFISCRNKIVEHRGVTKYIKENMGEGGEGKGEEKEGGGE